MDWMKWWSGSKKLKCKVGAGGHMEPGTWAIMKLNSLTTRPELWGVAGEARTLFLTVEEAGVFPYGD